MSTHTLLLPGGFYPGDGDGNNPTHEALTQAARHHAGLLHPKGRPGRVAIGRRDPTAENGWREDTFSVSQLPAALAEYAGAENVYVSMQRFRGWRRIAKLRELGAVFSDVDFYKVPELAGRDPEHAAAYVLDAIERAGLPSPSLVIVTGRGLVLVWLHGAVPRAALPRWNAMQKVIFEALRPFGADASAKDAARVLRMCGTVHGKSGETVRVIGGDEAVWDFEDLANEVLPEDRERLAELHDMRVQRALRRKASGAAQKPADGHGGHPQGWTGASLWEGRLSDLQTLREARYGAGVPMEDFRDRWLLLAGTAISWITFPPFLKREIMVLAEEIGYPEQAAKANMEAVFDRAKRSARGETIEFAGIEWDTRYHYKNETIIEVLEIEPHEERLMRTIISDGERKSRRRERKEKERREAGAVSRAEYTAAADRDRVRAAELRVQGLTQRQIADALGCSQQRVSKLLKGIDKGIQRSVPLNSGVAGPVDPPKEHPGRLFVGYELQESSEVESARAEHPAPPPPPAVSSTSLPPKCSPPLLDQGGPVPALGFVISAEFEAAKDHPLGCACLLCSVPAPHYAGGAR